MDVGLLLFVSVLLGYISNAASAKNVLLLIADDLRPQLYSYNGHNSAPSNVHPHMHTPNIDNLASKGMLFRQAYVQQALCSPSRSSFLTGRRPDTTKVFDLDHFFRDVGGNFTTMPQFFKENGYATAGLGKVFHLTQSGKNDPMSWSLPFFAGSSHHEDKVNSWKAIPDSQLHNSPLIDQQIANHAVQMLESLAHGAKSGNHPFFMAVGFHKPHLPFVFPASFMHYYPESQIQLPDNPYPPTNLPHVAWSGYGELLAYHDVASTSAHGTFNTSLPDKKVLELRRAYYSAVSYMDSLVGQVVDSLETLGLSNDTIVAFVGDHGWQLGEHGEWCKHTNFELATHAPMIIRIPGKTDHGLKIGQLVEFVDLFPTIVEAAGFNALHVCPNDSRHTRLCTEGLSLLPLIDHPSTALKRAAFSQYPRHGGSVMGYTIRTFNFRYTEWVRYSNGPDWNSVVDRELYDHKKDPYENHNVVDDHSYNSQIEDLKKRLHGGWRSAIIAQGTLPIVG